MLIFLFISNQRRFLLQETFNNLNDSMIIQILKILDSHINDIDSFNSNLNTISKILLNISTRNTSSETQFLVIEFMNTINLVLNLPLDVLKASQSSYNSSNKYFYF